MKNCATLLSITALTALTAACGTASNDDILGSWNCKSQMSEDGMTGSMDFDITYVSSGKSSGMGTLILGADGQRIDMDVAMNGEWNIHGDLLEETVSSISLISASLNGTPLTGEQLDGMRALIDPIMSASTSSKIQTMTATQMILEESGELATCTR